MGKPPIGVIGVYRFSAQLVYKQGDLTAMVGSVTDQLNNLHFDR